MTRPSHHPRPTGPCTLAAEERLRKSGARLVAGVDEAGRGCLAGPVVAAAVVLPATFDARPLDDSKRLTPRQRDEAFARLSRLPPGTFAIATVDAPEIDRVNILRATHRAMRQALEALDPRPCHALVDGLPVPDLPLPHSALVGGDSLSLSIAAASILAKVTRDRIMNDYDRLFPAYGFARHKGYATRQHHAMLHHHGPCPIHRKTFAPVARLLHAPHPRTPAR